MFDCAICEIERLVRGTTLNWRRRGDGRRRSVTSSVYFLALAFFFISLMSFQNKFFRRRNPKDLLPAQPVEDISFDWWWKVNIGYITEEDVKVSTASQRYLHQHDIDVESSSAIMQTPSVCLYIS